MGTISGGLLTNRVSPLTTSVSLLSACMLSRVLALATSLSARILAFERALSVRLPLGEPELVTHLLEDAFDVQSCVPDVEIAHRRQFGHLRPIGPDGPRDDVRAFLGGEPAISTGDGQTGREALHIPFPGTGKRLVEVVQIEDQVPFGGAEDPEIAQMCVPTCLHVEAGSRCRGQVRRHDQGGTPVEGEG